MAEEEEQEPNDPATTTTTTTIQAPGLDEPTLINETYRVGRRIGSGTFGMIRAGENVRTGRKVAIKLERPNSEPSLELEHSIYQRLAGQRGFPEIYYFGPYRHYQVLVMEMLSKDLETLFERCGRRFSMKSLLFLTLQLLKRFETLHSLGIIYRDVKPDNFMMGIGTNSVKVVDFGLAKYWRDPTTGEHIPFQVTNTLTGTQRYMSINAHLGRELSRRDDLEALAYVFIYFLRGRLPWSGIRARSRRDKNYQICRLKSTTPEDKLVKADEPRAYLYYLQYARVLDFEAAPNYPRMRDMFKRAFHQLRLVDDGVYDWNQLN